VIQESLTYKETSIHVYLGSFNCLYTIFMTSL